MGFLKKFLPKKSKFYQLLNELSSFILEAAELLNEMLEKWDNFSEYASHIHLLEHKCDDLTHQLINELNETFITPIDREDIHALANSLDNIIDCIDVIANRIHIYKVKNPIDFAPQLTEILLLQLKLLSEVVNSFEEHKDVFSKLIKIRNYETEGDKIFQNALSQLFDNEKDHIELIKKKEILEILEQAIDRCQTATIVIESIEIKNA